MITRLKKLPLCFLSLVFISVAIGQSSSPWLTLTNPMTEKIVDFIRKNPEVNSKEKFIASLPEDLKRNWILMYESESAQQAACFEPRLILQSADSKILMGVETRKNEIGQPFDKGVEITHFDPFQNKFHYSEIKFENEKAKYFSNPTSCKACHGHNPRPNWDAYDSWANMLPFNRDRIYEGSEEEKAFKYTLQHLAHDPVFKELRLPAGVKLTETGTGNDGKKKYEVEIQYDLKEREKMLKLPNGKEIRQGGRYLLLHDEEKGPTNEEGRGFALFERLNALNAERIAAEIVSSPNFARYKYVYKAALKGCIKRDGAWKDYIPASTLTENEAFIRERNPEFTPNRSVYAQLLEDTLKRKASLPKLKLKVQQKALRRLIECNAKVEGRTYTAEELDSLVMAEILRRAEASLDKPIIDRENYGVSAEGTAVWRYVLAPEGLDVERFSTGVLERSSTFTFAGLYLVISDAIRNRLNQEVPTNDCNELKRLSLRAYQTPKIDSGLVNRGSPSGEPSH